MSQVFKSPLARAVERSVEIFTETALTNANSAPVAARRFTSESYGATESNAADNLGGSYATAMETLCSDLAVITGAKVEYTAAQIAAAKIAAVAAGGGASAVKRKPVGKYVATEGHVPVVPMMGTSTGDYLEQRMTAFENYDDRDNRNMVQYSATYNLNSARQHKAAEMWFPTITVPLDQVGFVFRVSMTTVQDDIRRGITGVLANANRTNILRAVVNPNILKDDTSLIVPVVRNENATMFVDDALIAPKSVMVSGEAVMTAPLLAGAEVDLIGLAQTDGMLARGSVADGLTDSLDTTVRLKNVYIKVGDDVIQLHVENLLGSTFVGAGVQGDTRGMNLNFDNQTVTVSGTTTKVDGTALTSLSALATSSLRVRLSLNLSGNVNLRSGKCQIFGNRVAIYNIYDADGNVKPLTTAPGSAIKTLFDGAEVLGYDVLASRSNLNRRMRGQLIDRQSFDQAFAVRQRSPITVLHPVTDDGQADYSDLEDMIATTRIRTTNSAVDKIIETAAMLKKFKADNTDDVVNPQHFGIGSWYVRPAFQEADLDLREFVDSENSAQRAADISAAVVNKLRDMAYDLFLESEYGVALDHMYAGNAPTPTLIIITDPYNASWVQIPGDTRTSGIMMNMKLEDMYNERMQNHFYFTFALDSADKNETPNPLNSGNMGWAPESTVVLPITRDGQTSKELCVQPRYDHYQHLPIMGVLRLTNVKEVLGKVSRHFKDVA